MINLSRIDDLLKLYCSNGVPFEKISNVYTRLKGTPITAAKMKEVANDAGDITIIAGGKTIVKAFEKDIPKCNTIKVPALLVQSRGLIDFVYIDSPFTFKNEMWAYTAKSPISVKYLYYVLKKDIDHFRNAASGMGSMPQISLSITEEHDIPYPPLPIQEEIVRILDTFTELTAELTLRKKQYEFYRDKLLSFDGLSEEERERLGVRWMAIGEFANCYTGATPKTQHSDYWVDGTIPWMSSGEVNKGEIFDTNEKITQNGYESCSTKMVPANTVVVALAGQGKTRGTVAITRIPLCTNQSLCSIVTNENVLSEYLLHYLKGKYVKLREISSGDGTRGGLNLKMIRDFVIPVPDIATQKTIVNILGNFEQISNSIFNGIPAEINLRQKQYEYYRDKLLSFDKGISGAY